MKDEYILSCQDRTSVAYVSFGLCPLENFITIVGNLKFASIKILLNKI